MRKRKDSTKWVQDLDKGGLHQSLGAPQSQKISTGKLRAARAGRYGKKAQKQAIAAKTLAKLRKRRKK